MEAFNLELLNADHYGVYISWAIFGLIAGIIAKLIMPGRDPGGLLVTAGLGVAGAFVGNYVYAYCTGETYEITRQFSLSGLFMAVLGGLCVLIAYRILFGRLGGSRA